MIRLGKSLNLPALEGTVIKNRVWVVRIWLAADFQLQLVITEIA